MEAHRKDPLQIQRKKKFIVEWFLIPRYYYKFMSTLAISANLFKKDGVTFRTWRSPKS